jgi:Mn2+/Fe2+ NRAMP family transporter
MALRYGGLDSGISLMLAFFVNAAILILAAAAFYYGPNRNTNVESITQAYPLLAPARGNHAC